MLFATLLQKTLRNIRPIFRERGKINAEVTGRLTESLGGVRVVKGYHAEDREAGVFSGGVQRLLDNVMKSLTVTSLMRLPRPVLMGLMGSLVMYLGARQALAQPHHDGRLCRVHDVSGLPGGADLSGGESARS